jgi:hypothetical protein
MIYVRRIGLASKGRLRSNTTVAQFVGAYNSGGQMLSRGLWTFRCAAAIIIVCAQLSGQIVSTRCDSSELSKDATPATVLTYLSQDRLNLNSACISVAIDILRAKKPIPAVPVLIKYLDFRIPVPQVLRHTHEATDGLYPAADALARFGNTAVPALEEAVGNDDLSAIGRSNAAKELFVEATDTGKFDGVLL